MSALFQQDKAEVIKQLWKSKSDRIGRVRIIIAMDGCDRAGDSSNFGEQLAGLA